MPIYMYDGIHVCQYTCMTDTCILAYMYLVIVVIIVNMSPCKSIPILERKLGVIN